VRSAGLGQRSSVSNSEGVDLTEQSDQPDGDKERELTEETGERVLALEGLSERVRRGLA
jgi:hypothetical protein